MAHSFDDPAGLRSDVHLAVQAKRAGRVKGESLASDHQDDIVVHAWDWGLSAGHALGSTQKTARRSYQELSVVKSIDAATTPLMSALATNDELKEVVLSMRRCGGGQFDYLRIKLSGARIVSLRQQTDAGGITSETVTFAFTQVEVQYTPQKADGSAGAATTFTDQVIPS
ncbi:MAG: type VI secretion system tube protein Hcp [Proteobacteria bacterium]|nr:type VI secretion system tube protein Hcp [Pseudomonadota bacterium]